MFVDFQWTFAMTLTATAELVQTMRPTMNASVFRDSQEPIVHCSTVSMTPRVTMMANAGMWINQSISQLTNQFNKSINQLIN